MLKQEKALALPNGLRHTASTQTVKLDERIGCVLKDEDEEAIYQRARAARRKENLFFTARRDYTQRQSDGNAQKCERPRSL
jgi:hypothetical protein